MTENHNQLLERRPWHESPAEDGPVGEPPASNGHQLASAILEGLPLELSRAAYGEAPGNEIGSGKFFSPESSSALVANAFGFFLEEPAHLPPLPGTPVEHWPATRLTPEGIVRFPWNGGRHPCLDVLVDTRTALIGVESKRFEPFRPKGVASFSDAYWRSVWGNAMRGYEEVRVRLRCGTLKFAHLDAAQLVKHAFGLRTATTVAGPHAGRSPHLVYLHAEPRSWPDGRPVPESSPQTHAREIAEFAALVAGDEVRFSATPYREMLRHWQENGTEGTRAHASRVLARFDL